MCVVQAETTRQLQGFLQRGMEVNAIHLKTGIVDDDAPQHPVRFKLRIVQ